MNLARLWHLGRELAKFGVVGALAAAVDVALFNVLLVGVGLGPVTAKVGSSIVATVVAYLGNRYWTFRHRDSAGGVREVTLFIVFNVCGLGIALLCLVVSHYILGFTSALADNISGNLVGFLVSTLFRFYTYRRWVFTATPTAPAQQANA